MDILTLPLPNGIMHFTKEGRKTGDLTAAPDFSLFALGVLFWLRRFDERVLIFSAYFARFAV